MSRSPELIGHRGAPRERPENTLASFLRALDLGADAVELDVHATRDGVVVVHHDAVPRADTTEASLRGRPIAGLTLAELSTYHVAGEPIPTLADVLVAIVSRARVYVEVKGRGIESQVVDTIARATEVENVPLHSFDHRVVTRARAVDPRVQGGILSASYLVNPDRSLQAASARDYWQEWSMIDADLVQTIHAVGGRVIAWTVNDPEAARHLAEIGVDGICTDVLPIVGRAVGRAA
ncbi:MAG: glycerophosphodiester phosphodiesterase [Gemmatimonadota bacterium]|nr:glycerophosphodiester phosphodiesterase [Gemmatimonadota bacterium]